MNITWFNYALVGPGEETINHLAVTEVAKCNHLLTDLTLGGRTPSQLLNRMKQLSGA